MSRSGHRKIVGVVEQGASSCDNDTAKGKKPARDVVASNSMIRLNP